MAGELKSKVAIVTGAGGGIGRPTALQLAAAGASVAVVDVDAAMAEQTAAQIEAAGGRAIALSADIADEAAVSAMVQATERAFGGLDVLVNNAARGAAGDHDLLSMTVAVWDQVMIVNTRGTMLCCKHAVPAMIRRGGGSVVNISSGAALTGQLTLTAYAAAKAAVISLTRSVATLHGVDGIRCNAIAPGLILHDKLAAAMPPAFVQMDRDNVLLPYQGGPADIAGAVLFLASDASRFITGHVLPVDGGLLAHTPIYAATRALADDSHYGVQGGVLGSS